MKLFQSYQQRYQRYHLLVSNLFRPVFLLAANFYFKKDYPQVDLSSFSSIRLSRMCVVRGRFPDLDIPLLSDEELDRLYIETNMLYAKDTAKAAWWITKTSVKLPFKVLQRTVSGVAEGSAKFDRLTASLSPMTGSSGSKVSAKPYESGNAMSQKSDIKRLEFEVQMYEKKYEEGMRGNAGDRKYANEITLSVLNDKRRDLSFWLERHEEQKKQDAISDEIFNHSKKR
jgi:hypothetical protein